MSGAGPILLVGAGLFAEDVTDVALDAGFDVLGLIEGLDADRADPSRKPPIVWVGDQAGFARGTPIAPAIGPIVRAALMERLLAEGRTLATIVHPSAVIARSLSSSRAASCSRTS